MRCDARLFSSLLFARLIKVSIQSILGYYVSFEYALPSGTVYSLIVSFGFIPIIDNIVLFILFTILFKFLTQIVDTFSGLEALGHPLV